MLNKTYSQFWRSRREKSDHPRRKRNPKYLAIESAV